MTASFFLDDAQAAVLVIDDNGLHNMCFLLTPGDASSGPEGLDIPPPGTPEQLAAHLASIPPPAPPTPAEKLAAAGLSIDELKELLGLYPAAGEAS